jgi:tetratricopeptide (TPR) repeat protein/predicted phosphodiesterase
MGGLTWLHLSDWHQGNKEFDRQVVGDALIEDLERRTTISPDLTKIDFIVFSGDVAHSGKPEEYQAAKVEFFDRILRATGLGPDQLFIVPGNHDLNRDEFELLPPALLKPLESDTEVQKWIVEERQRGLVLQPLNSFTKFVTDYTKQKNPDFANIHRLVVDGKKIAVLGLNSAWMCGRHTDINGEVDDEGYALVGEPQIHQSLKDMQDADIKVAILHHPFEWLREFDCRHVEERLINECDFILNGHRHTPVARQISRNNGFYVHISTGAIYLDRISKDPLFINAYNLVHFDFETNQGIVFLRRWSDRQTEWLEDTDTRPPNGRRPFSLVSALTDASPVQIMPEKKISIVAPESVSIIIPRQIPRPPSDFKGRDEEISDILANFDKGATITGLHGMPGVGKTVLAFVLAERLKDRFSDGQLFINLQGTSKSPLSHAEAMAQVIHAYRPTDRLPENQDELRGLYLSILSGKRALLLFDNAAGKEQVEPLLPPANCAVLITSRIKFILPGLKEKDLDVLPTNEACELLLGIAERIGDRAEELAKLCGYLPLALRNAASVLAEKRDLVVVEYERLLNDKRKRLELVEASFSLCYDLLSPMRKKQWGRLSVFPEDFDLNGAAAVWMMGRDPSVDALSDLVKWSLVNFNPSTDPGEEGRYRLHDLARIFAESRLDSSQRADVQYRHSKHYLKVLLEASKLYVKGGISTLPGLWLFDKEWVNIKAGQAWAEGLIGNARKLKNDGELKHALQLANSYPPFGIDVLLLRLYPQEIIHWHETALATARMTKNRDDELVHLGNLGNAYARLDKIRKAIEFYERCLSGKRKIEYGKNEGNTLNSLGNAYFALGETNKAKEFYKQAQLILNRLDYRRVEGGTIGNLGVVYLYLGDTRKAFECGEQALAIAKEIGDRADEGYAIGNLGSTYAQLGEIRKAIEYKRTGISHSQRDRRSLQ